MRRKSKWVKFLEREKKLELREETEWHNNIEKSINDKIYTSVQSETMTKKEESKDKLNLTDMENYNENGKRLSWVTENRTQRKKKKTFAEVLQIGLEKEGTFVVKEGINAVVNSPTKEIDTVNKVTLDLSEIYNDLLKSEQNGSSPMPNLPSPICTDTSTSKIASNSTIGNGCESDVCLNDYDKEILSILEDFSVRETLLRVNPTQTFHLYERKSVGCLVILRQIWFLTRVLTRVGVRGGDRFDPPPPPPTYIFYIAFELLFH